MVESSYKNYLSRKRGISTIVGGIIFLVLLTAGFSTFFVAMDVQSDTVNAQRTISNSIIEKTQEQFSIAAVTDTCANQCTLGIQVKNEGPNPIQISNIWIINKSLPTQPAKNIQINFSDAYIPPGYGLSIVENQLLKMDAPLAPPTPDVYDIKVVSTIGTIKQTEISVGGSNYLLAELFTIPPDVAHNENVTLALRVTNVGPSEITGITPDLDFAPAGIEPLKETWLSVPEPILPVVNPVDLNPSESIIFSWQATLNTVGPFNSKIKFSNSVSGTESTTGFVVTSNTASDKIVVRDPTGGGGEEDVIKEELFGKPNIFMIMPNAAGDEDSFEIDRPIWGVMVANPTDQDMYVTKVVITSISPRDTGNDKLFAKGCEGIMNKAENPETIAPTPDRWTCVESNQIQWKDIVAPQLVEPRSVFPFLVAIGSDNMGSSLDDAINLIIQPIVFTTLGQFSKPSYGTTMYSADVALPNVFLARNPNSVAHADIMGVQTAITEGSTITFYATLADMSSDSAYGINPGSRLIINIPNGWTFNGPICGGCHAGFDPPVVTTFPDGSTQIVGVLNTSIDDHTEAKSIEFSATAPSVTKAKMYVMYVLADGTATGNSNQMPPEDFTIGPLAETVLQVCPTSGCP